MELVTKKRNLNIVLLSFMIMVGIASCNSPAEKVEDAKENVVQVKEELAVAQNDYLIELAKFKKESTDELTENEKLIADLKSKMVTMKKDMQKDYNEKLEILEQKNRDMKKRVNEYTDDGNEKWQIFKKEFTHDMQELGNSFKDFTVNNIK